MGATADGLCEAVRAHLALRAVRNGDSERIDHLGARAQRKLVLVDDVWGRGRRVRGGGRAGWRRRQRKRVGTETGVERGGHGAQLHVQHGAHAAHLSGGAAEHGGLARQRLCGVQRMDGGDVGGGLDDGGGGGRSEAVGGRGGGGLGVARRQRHNGDGQGVVGAVANRFGERLLGGKHERPAGRYTTEING